MLICLRQIAPIHICAANDHHDLLEILIKNHADVRSYFFAMKMERFVFQINFLDGQGQTALHHAAKDGYINSCRCLITHKIDTLIVSMSGQTALDIASTSATRQLLLSKYFIRDDCHEDWFSFVAYEKEKIVLTPNITDLELQLLEASKSGDLDVVKVRSLSSTLVLSHGRSLIFIACPDIQSNTSKLPRCSRTK